MVFDKFHVVKKINEAVDTVRKKEFAKADKNERKEMKHKRWVILKHEKNLKKEEKETLDEFNSVLKMMQTHLYGIMNYFRFGMTNAITEGFNTKINILKRRAFGFTDLEYFSLKIFQSSIKRLS